jgi:hypothetical protein
MESLVFEKKKHLPPDSTQIPKHSLAGISPGTWRYQQKQEGYKDIGRITTTWNNLPNLSLVTYTTPV